MTLMETISMEVIVNHHDGRLINVDYISAKLEVDKQKKMAEITDKISVLKKGIL
jgi:hypothetical protein